MRACPQEERREEALPTCSWYRRSTVHDTTAPPEHRLHKLGFSTRAEKRSAVWLVGWLIDAQVVDMIGRRLKDLRCCQSTLAVDICMYVCIDRCWHHGTLHDECGGMERANFENNRSTGVYGILCCAISYTKYSVMVAVLAVNGGCVFDVCDGNASLC